MIIYKATNLVNGKVYIGETIQSFKTRKARHLRDAFNSPSNFAFHKALRKYGKENFIWEIIDEATTQEELNEKEKHWIKHYNSFGCNGYNMTDGGEGKSGYSLSEDSRQKIRESLIGRQRPEETKRKVSEARIRNSIGKGTNNNFAKLTEEDIINIKELIKLGHLQVDIAKKYNVSKAVISSIKKGRTWSHTGDDVSNYSNIINTKLTLDDVVKIKQLIKNGKNSIIEIANIYNVNEKTIRKIKAGKSWKSIGDDVSEIMPINRKLTEVEVIEIRRLLIKGVLNQKEIAEKYGVSRSYINRIKNNKAWKDMSFT